RAPMRRNSPGDEPIFAAEVAEPLHEQHEHVLHAGVYEEVHGTVSSAAPEIAEVVNEARTVSETYSAPETTVHQMAREEDFVAAPQVMHDATLDVAHGAVE